MTPEQEKTFLLMWYIVLALLFVAIIGGIILTT